jgi:RNA polymerase-binding transcription factor DksA
MNFFATKITDDEKQNILDKHKTLYDGYSVKQSNNNEYPLYVQDLANDKEGVTMTSDNKIRGYTNNIRISESIEEGSVCEQCGGKIVENVCSECGEQYVEDLNGKFDYIENDEIDYDSDLMNSGDLDEIVKEQLKESLEMFKRLTKYN